MCIFKLHNDVYFVAMHILNDIKDVFYIAMHTSNDFKGVYFVAMHIFLYHSGHLHGRSFQMFGPRPPEIMSKDIK